MSKYIDKDKVLEYIIFGVVGKDITCGELTRAIESLPTIEVNEDCISREWVLEKFEKGRETISKSEYFDELIWLVIHAPSVVPCCDNEKSNKLQQELQQAEVTTEQSCDTCRHNKLEWFSEECDGCTKADSNWERIEE